MSFAFYFKPSGTINVASTGTYGVKDALASVTLDSISPTGPTATPYNDSAGVRWLVFFDGLGDDAYTVQLEDSDGPPQPDPFEFTVNTGLEGLTISHPAPNGTVRAQNVVAWGDSSHNITEAKLTYNGVTYTGTVLRDGGGTVPYIVQFPSVALLAPLSGTLKIKNSNGDEVTIPVTVDP
jgi:hypothetical protein